MTLLRSFLLFSLIFSLLICTITASPLAKAATKAVRVKRILPVAIKSPMGVPTKKNAAKAEKLEEIDRRLLLGLICFMEFGANNELFRALNAGDKNNDGKLTIEEFNNYYNSNEELQAIVYHSKEEMFQLFDRNKDGLLSAGDTLTSSGCERAKEEKTVILPRYMEETFDDNLDAAMYIKNAGEFNTLMQPIRKYILFLYDNLREGRMTPMVINFAIWGACRDIKMGGVVNCKVLDLDEPSQMAVIRQWIKLLMLWSRTHPLV